MPQNTYSSTLHDLRQSLQHLYDGGESAAIARAVLFNVSGISHSQSLGREESLTDAQLVEITAIKAKMLAGMPMQYAIGQVDFMSRKFAVDQSVLIPRPETEELVSWVLDEYPVAEDLTIIDVGTGSGCIAVTIKAKRCWAKVSAIDLSLDALSIASKNAQQNDALVDFQKMDFLDKTARDSLGVYDVIISNPPYIPATEGGLMAPNVMDWEPHTALFVSDNEPLIFYHALADFGLAHLKDGGAVFCEIHKDYGTQTADLFRQAGYKNVILKQDISGNDRMVRASLK